MLQFSAATVALQLCVPSLTVTVPVGVPLPGAVAATVNVKLAGWPTAEGFGDWPVMAGVVAGAVKIGRGAWRERGWISVGAVSLKKKKTSTARPVWQQPTRDKV